MGTENERRSEARWAKAPRTGRGILRRLPDGVALALFLPLAAAVMVLLPVLLPLLAVDLWLLQRRKRAVASRTACLRCGQVLGAAAVDEADRVRAVEMQARFAANPGVRFRRERVARTLDALCTACGARYLYDEAARAYHPAPDPLPAAATSRATLGDTASPFVLERQGLG